MCLCLNQLVFFVVFSCFDGNDGSWFPQLLIKMKLRMFSLLLDRKQDSNETF